MQQAALKKENWIKETTGVVALKEYKKHKAMRGVSTAMYRTLMKRRFLGY